MKPINKEIFVCVDCETTGLDVKEDCIIEVAAICFNGDEIFDQYETLVDPGRLIPPESTKIHHITDAMVKGKPSVKEILPELLAFIGDHIIIGHGIGFDIDVITYAAENAGIPCQLRKNLSIDTLRMARLYGESPVNSLGYLSRHFNIEADGAHRAMNDVIMNRAVFGQLAKPYKSAQELLKILKKPVKMKNMPLGKHKGRPMREIPLEYLKWAASKDFDRDLLFSIRSEINRRKKGTDFHQAANPFKDL